MTDKAKAAAIKAKWDAGWRFAIDWPPGFATQTAPAKQRGGQLSENTGKAWRGIVGPTNIRIFRP